MMSTMSWFLATAHAQTLGLLKEGIPGCDFASGNIKPSCIPNFIAYAIELIFGLIGLLCLVNIMYAGYQIALGSSGVVGSKEAGKERLQWSLIGLAISVSAFLILDFVASALFISS